MTKQKEKKTHTKVEQQSKKEGKDQKLIQSSTTPDQRHRIEK